MRNTRPDDIPALLAISREVYAPGAEWTDRELRFHPEVFPEGQHVAVEKGSERILGMAASLILLWDD